MHHIKIEKIQAINRYKKQQLVYNIFLYSLTALTCIVFCSSPFWYPPLCSCVNVFLYISLPNISSLLFSSKSLFIVGNLIVIFLVGESKVFSNASSSASDVYYDEYVSSSRKLRSSFSAPQRKREKKMERFYEAKAEISSEDGEDKERCGEGKVKGKEETETQHKRKEKIERFSEAKAKIDSEDGKVKGKEEKEDLDGKCHIFPAEEVNKRADDFIARVNKQRKLEAKLLLCNGD